MSEEFMNSIERVQKEAKQTKVVDTVEVKHFRWRNKEDLYSSKEEPKKDSG